jgi:hypothetical protein
MYALDVDFFVLDSGNAMSNKRRAQKPTPKATSNSATPKRLAILSAVLALVSYVSKDILADHVKGLHDSIEKAEANFDKESSQSDLYLQTLAIQHELEAIKLQNDPNIKSPKKDFSYYISLAVSQVRGVESHIDLQFENLAHLVGTLPDIQSKTQLRHMMDEAKPKIEQAKKNTEDALKVTSDHDQFRYIQIRIAEVLELLQGIQVALISDLALTEARRIEGVYEARTKLCTWLTYALGLSSLVLGLFAASRGLKKSEAA